MGDVFDASPAIVEGRIVVRGREEFVVYWGGERGQETSNFKAEPRPGTKT